MTVRGEVREEVRVAVRVAGCGAASTALCFTRYSESTVLLARESEARGQVPL